MNNTQQTQYNRLKAITVWLDTKFEGPFGWRFGVDPLIGLIPILGDLVTVCFSIYILISSFLLGCSYAVFLRMLLNIAIEFVVELVPGLGQVFDFFWKANTKNMQLLDQHMQDPLKTHRHSLGALFAVFFTLLIFIVSCIALAIFALKQLLMLIQNVF
jgi:Domain of unknown function (DUF4112)